MQNTIKPKFNNKIGICFSCNDKYIKILSVALKSIVDNASDDRTYDIIVLHKDITDISFEILNKICNQKNFSIRLYNVSEFLKNHDNNLFYLNYHYHISTYYRLFITDIFKYFGRVIYFDADMIFNYDISKLYDIDFEDSYLIASRDLYIQILLDKNIGEWKDYAKNILRLENPYNYIQAGLLIFNIKKCIENGISNQLIARLQEIKEPRIVDQCIINSVLYDKIKFLDNEWDLDLNIFDLLRRFGNNNILKEAKEKFYEAFKNAKIIHYAGKIKPWEHIFMPKSYLFWKYALKTPVFKDLVLNFISKFIRKLKLLLKFYWE